MLPPVTIHDAAMWSAYLETTYVAAVGEGERSIRVGQDEPWLEALLSAHHCTSWCFVTAWNPASTQMTEAQNDARNALLEGELRSAGHPMFEGHGRGSDERWPAEASFLVLGIGRAEATDLGRQHGQNAVVFGEAGGHAELIDCRARATARD